MYIDLFRGRFRQPANCQSVWLMICCSRKQLEIDWLQLCLPAILRKAFRRKLECLCPSPCVSFSYLPTIANRDGASSVAPTCLRREPVAGGHAN